MAADKEHSISNEVRLPSETEHNINVRIFVTSETGSQIPEPPVQTEVIPLPPSPRSTPKGPPNNLLRFALAAGGLFLLATQSLVITSPGRSEDDGYFRQSGWAIGNNTKTLSMYPDQFRAVVGQIPSGDYDDQQYKLGNLYFGHYGYYHDENWDNLSMVLDLGPTELRFEQIYAQVDQQPSDWTIDSSLFHVAQKSR